MSDRTPEVAREVVDTKLCPTEDFRGDRSVLTAAYTAFDAAAKIGARSDVFQEDFAQRDIAEIYKRA